MFSKRDLFKLIWPMMLQQILLITVSTADSMMVASAGEAAVSGVSLIGTLDSLLVLMFSSMVTGGTVCISHALGRGEQPYSRECAKQLIYITTGIALAITLLSGAFRQPLLKTLFGSAEADVLASANSYMAIMVLSFPFLALYNAGVAIFRTVGDTVTGLRLSIVINVLNIIGNAVCILGFHMGAAGAALATLIARVICAFIVILRLHNRKNVIYIENLFRYRPDGSVIRQILSIGVPHGVENSMFQIGRLATQVLISAMGTAAIAANSVANTLATYLYLPSNAISDAAITVVGRCYGANEMEQTKKYTRLLLWWSYLCMWLVSALLMVLAGPIIGIYHLSEEGTAIALQLTIFHCVSTCIIRPPAFMLPSAFKATGDAKFTMVVSTLSMWIVRVGLAFVLAPEVVPLPGVSIPGFGMGIMGVWVAMVADWVVRGGAYIVRFLRGTWLKQRH